MAEKGGGGKKRKGTVLDYFSKKSKSVDVPVGSAVQPAPESESAR
jgi:hypothetical protein